MANDSQKLTIVLEGDSKKLQKALKAANDAMQDFDEKAKKSSGKGGGMGMLQTAFKRLAAYAVAGITIRGVSRFVTDSVKMASSLEGIERAFKNVTFASSVTIEKLRQSTGGAVSDLKLMKATVQASNFKLPLENLGSLFEFARVRAQQTGESVEYLTNSIVLGIGRKSPLILDNLGITMVRLKEAMGGTIKSSMSVAQLMEAVSKIAKEETEIVRMLGLTTQTSSEKMASLSASVENLKASFGDDIVKSGWFDNLISGAKKAIAGITQSGDISDVKDILGFEGNDVEFAKFLKRTDLIERTRMSSGGIRPAFAMQGGVSNLGRMTEEVNNTTGLLEAALDAVANRSAEAVKKISEQFGSLNASELRQIVKKGEVDAYAEEWANSAQEIYTYKNAFHSLIQEKDRGDSVQKSSNKLLLGYADAITMASAAHARHRNELTLVKASIGITEKSMDELMATGLGSSDVYKELAKNLNTLQNRYADLSFVMPEFNNNLDEGTTSLDEMVNSLSKLEQKAYAEIAGWSPETEMSEEKADDPKLKNRAENLERMKSILGGLSQAFVSAASSGESFGDILGSVFKRLAAQLASMVASTLIIAGLMSIGGGAKAFAGNFKSLIGGQGGFAGNLLGGLFGIDKKTSANVAGAARRNIGSSASTINVNVQGQMRGNDLYLAGQRGSNFINKRLG